MTTQIKTVESLTADDRHVLYNRCRCPGCLVRRKAVLEALNVGHVCGNSVSTDKLDRESRHVGDDDTESVLREDDSLKSG